MADKFEHAPINLFVFILTTYTASLAQVHDTYAPQVSIPSASYNGELATTLTIPCTIDANPDPHTVLWRRTSARGETILSLSSPKGKYLGGTPFSPSLTINNLQPSDAAWYQCQAFNTIGSGISNAVNVTINFPPRHVVLNPSGPVINLNEGCPLNLTCSADAVPSPTYTWKAGSTVIGNGSSLVITSAGPGDNREVTCEVTNSRGLVAEKTRINVLCNHS